MAAAGPERRTPGAGRCGQGQPDAPVREEETHTHARNGRAHEARCVLGNKETAAAYPFEDYSV